MLAGADAFFGLPTAAKLASTSPAAEINRGYAALGTESLTYSLGVDAPPDLFEAFNIGPEHVDESDPVIAAERHRIFAPNIWPARHPTGAARPRGGLLRRGRPAWPGGSTSIFAVALGLAEDFFVDKTDHSTDTLRVIRYERQPGSPDPLPGQVRMGAHTDYGIVHRALRRRGARACRSWAPDGEWHGVVPVEGRLPREPRRPAGRVDERPLALDPAPGRAATGRRRPPALRRSAAFFHDGNYDALVEVLSTCCSPDDPPRYPPVLAGDHLMAKLTAPRNQVVSTATDFAGDRLDAMTR